MYERGGEERERSPGEKRVLREWGGPGGRVLKRALDPLEMKLHVVVSCLP